MAVVNVMLFVFCGTSYAAEWHVVENIDAVIGAGAHSKNLGRVDDTGKAGLEKCQVPLTGPLLSAFGLFTAVSCLNRHICFDRHHNTS